jgi:hypothetical protein
MERCRPQKNSFLVLEAATPVVVHGFSQGNRETVFKYNNPKIFLKIWKICTSSEPKEEYWVPRNGRHGLPL